MISHLTELQGVRFHGGERVQLPGRSGRPPALESAQPLGGNEGFAVEEPDFDALWRQHGDHVVRYCHRYTQAAGEAEEVCQRVALRAWRHFSTLRDRKTYLSWVLAIA